MAYLGFGSAGPPMADSTSLLAFRAPGCITSSTSVQSRARISSYNILRTFHNHQTLQSLGGNKRIYETERIRASTFPFDVAVVIRGVGQLVLDPIFTDKPGDTTVVLNVSCNQYGAVGERNCGDMAIIRSHAAQRRA